MGEVRGPVIVWFRSDLRIDDNPALNAAIRLGCGALPVFILDAEGDGIGRFGGASRWWLHHALSDLAKQLERMGMTLVLRKGDSRTELLKLVKDVDSSVVYWNHRYEPRLIQRDKRIRAHLKSKGCETESFNASLLFEPHEIENKSGNPFRVFTPFWKHCLSLEKQGPDCLERRKSVAFNSEALWNLSLDALKLLPSVNWDKGFYEAWIPTVEEAETRLRVFAKESASDYETARDKPSIEGTSRLSPYLRFGQIGPRQIWKIFAEEGLLKKDDSRKYLAEIGWREFSYHLLYHFPDTVEHPLNPRFEAFPWSRNESFFEAWSLWMPACGNCGPQAGCIIAYVWSPLLFW